MTSELFGTAITCIDGRVQEPIARWMKNHFSLDAVDMITEPGPDKAMQSPSVASELKRKAGISLAAHNSRALAFAAHADCAGNPVSDDEHKIAIRECVTLLTSWNMTIPIVGLWVDAAGNVEEVMDKI